MYMINNQLILKLTPHLFYTETAQSAPGRCSRGIYLYTKATIKFIRDTWAVMIQCSSASNHNASQPFLII